MDIAALIVGGGGIWRGKPPASKSVLDQLRATAPAGVPESYLQFLSFSNGGEGDLGIEPGWFCPWPAQEVIAANNDYEVSQMYGNYFGFGSNGGGELLAFDLSYAPPWPVVMIPFIGGAKHVVRIAQDFDVFLASVGRPIESADG